MTETVTAPITDDEGSAFADFLADIDAVADAAEDCLAAYPGAIEGDALFPWYDPEYLADLLAGGRTLTDDEAAEIARDALYIAAANPALIIDVTDEYRAMLDDLVFLAENRATPALMLSDVDPDQCGMPNLVPAMVLILFISTVATLIGFVVGRVTA